MKNFSRCVKDFEGERCQEKQFRIHETIDSTAPASMYKQKLENGFASLTIFNRLLLFQFVQCTGLLVFLLLMVYKGSFYLYFL